jgi:hypothetical protein
VGARLKHIKTRKHAGKRAHTYIVMQSYKATDPFNYWLLHAGDYKYLRFVFLLLA